MYNYNSYDAVGAAFLGIAVIVIIISVIALGIAILQIIGTWKILKKANKPGWAGIIPIYNTYQICKITGVNPWWILIVVLSPFLSFIPIIGSLASIAVSIYFSILLNVSLARSFGKEDSYAVGLILLSPIFYLILGCGNAKYIGEKPMNDIIFKDNNNANDKNVSKDSKFCSNCGKQVAKNTKFCPNCGKEIK